MTDATDEREPMNDVETALLRVGCARFDDQVVHEDFVTLVNTLVDAVRTDERSRAEILSLAPPASDAARPALRRFLTDDDRAEVARRFAAAEKTPDGKVKRGWKDATALALGLTKSQVTIIITEINGA